MKNGIVTLILLISSISGWSQTDKEKAAAHYDTALVAFKTDYQSQEEFIAGMNKADTEVNNSLRLDQTNPEAFFLRGKLFAMQKRWENVIEVLNYAIELDNTQWEYYMRRGMSHGILKHRVESINDLDTSIELAPDQGAPYYHRGMQHYGQMHDEMACADFAKAVVLGFEQAQQAINSYCGG
jgi:tetratricopeptide (TPR) repeat protein